MVPVTWRDRLRYSFDASLHRGPEAVILWLAGAAMLLVLVGGGFIVLLDQAPERDASEALWLSLTRALDPGNLAADRSWKLRAITLLTSLGGVLVISTLVGVLGSCLQMRLARLGRGRSRVLETGHVLVLGDSPHLPLLVSELVQAHGKRIVVLSERDKLEQEERLSNPRVICRRGSPMSVADLALVNPTAARSVVLLSPEHAEADGQVIRALLALTHVCGGQRPPTVAEIRETANADAARLAGGPGLHVVERPRMAAQVLVRSCLDPGISGAYEELLDFEGQSLFLKSEASLQGRSFGEALSAFEGRTLLGLRRADGTIEMNPRMETTIEAGDRLICLAARPDERPAMVRSANPAAIAPSTLRGVESTSILLLGWSNLAPIVLSELNASVGVGSRLTVVSERPVALPGLCHLETEVVLGDPASRELLEELDVQSFDHIVVLSGPGRPEAADARTLLTLLHLRDLETHECYNVVAELQDEASPALAQVTEVDDFVLPGRIAGLMMAQLALRGELAAVLQDLVDSEGSELHLKPAPDYVQAGSPVNFATVVEAARQRREVAVGYLRHRERLCVNPFKSQSVAFGPEDRILVLSVA